METDHLLSSVARHASVPSLSMRNFRTLPSSSAITSSLRSADHTATTTTTSTTTSKLARSTDAERIHQAAKAAGEPAFGVVMVDVWLYGEQGYFVHVEGSTWICPAFCARASAQERIAIDRIVDPQHARYSPPRPQVMGAGLASYFWSTLAMKPTRDHTNNEGSTHSSGDDVLLWRDLRALTSDPFQPPYPRMQVLQEAGLGKATGVPFEIQGTKGVVLYLTRPEADETVLSEAPNVHYLQAAAQFIGTACALSQPRRQVGRMRQTQLATTWRRLTTRIKSSPNLRKLRQPTAKSSLVNGTDSGLFGRMQWFCWYGQQAQTLVQNRLSLMARKMRGSDSITPPPPAPVRACLWTAAGVMFTLWILGILSDYAMSTTGQEILLAPFGAFLTLQYSLTAAPASQPRNAIYGQLLCLFLAWFWSSLFVVLKISSSSSSSLLLPTSVATGVALMQRFGVSHPPAAAAMVAVLSQPGGFTYTAALWLLIGNIMAVATAVLQNLSEHRAYPVYWKWGLVRACEDLIGLLGNSLTAHLSSPSFLEKIEKSPIFGDSPTVPSFYDSDGSMGRNYDAEEQGDDLPLQF